MNFHLSPIYKGFFPSTICPPQRYSTTFAMATLTLKDLHSFHSIDREIFTRLVINLTRDPAQSLLVMALWLCLEKTESFKLVKELTKLSNFNLNRLADEAVSFLRCLESKTPPELRDGEIPVTALIVGRTICLRMFYENKYTFLCYIKAYLKNVCAHIFADILSQIYPSRAILNHPLVIPGFPHPVYGSITVIPRTMEYVFASEGIWGWKMNIEAPLDDRTLFLTFSRGYSVTESEVRELFSSYYGDCVECISMEPSSSSPDQFLYARLVVRDIQTVDHVLARGPIAKFKINGKHVWARKFERREPN